MFVFWVWSRSKTGCTHHRNSRWKGPRRSPSRAGVLRIHLHTARSRPFLYLVFTSRGLCFALSLKSQFQNLPAVDFRPKMQPGWGLFPVFQSTEQKPGGMNNCRGPSLPLMVPSHHEISAWPGNWGGNSLNKAAVHTTSQKTGPE